MEGVDETDGAGVVCVVWACECDCVAVRLYCRSPHAYSSTCGPLTPWPPCVNPVVPIAPHVTP